MCLRPLVAHGPIAWWLNQGTGFKEMPTPLPLALPRQSFGEQKTQPAAGSTKQCLEVPAVPGPEEQLDPTNRLSSSNAELFFPTLPVPQLCEQVARVASTRRGSVVAPSVCN